MTKELEKDKGEKGASQRLKIDAKWKFTLIRRWRKFQKWFAKALYVDDDRKELIYIDLAKSCTIKDLVYWLQIFFSAGIATLGLVLDSSAVIIGAMLISPLMAPILSQGLALAAGDITLGVRAAFNVLLSSILAVTFALILVALLPFKDVTDEILARTQPNTLDLFVALFSGTIGTIATCKEAKGVVTSIPGVAIAVALMPPLCVVGFGLGFAVSVDIKGIGIASGGALLFLTNLVAITFSAMLVFLCLNMYPSHVRKAVQEWMKTNRSSVWLQNQFIKMPGFEKARESRSVWIRIIMIAVPLIIIFVPLSKSFDRLRMEYTQQQAANLIEANVRSIWESKYAEDTSGNVRSYIDEINISQSDGKLNIYMRIFESSPYSQQEQNQFKKMVAERQNLNPDQVSLVLLEIPTSERNEGSFIVEAVPTPESVTQKTNALVALVKSRMQGYLLPGNAELIDWTAEVLSDGSSNYVFYYLSGRDIDPDGQEALQNTLRKELQLPNAILKMVRIDPTPVKIVFESGSEELTTADREALGEVLEDLKAHTQLRIRVILSVENSDDSEDNPVVEKKKQSINDFFNRDGGISENRVVFSSTADQTDLDTVQLFLKE